MGLTGAASAEALCDGTMTTTAAVKAIEEEPRTHGPKFAGSFTKSTPSCCAFNAVSNDSRKAMCSGRPNVGQPQDLLRNGRWKQAVANQIRDFQIRHPLCWVPMTSPGPLNSMSTSAISNHRSCGTSFPTCVVRPDRGRGRHQDAVTLACSPTDVLSIGGCDNPNPRHSRSPSHSRWAFTPTSMTVVATRIWACPLAESISALSQASCGVDNRTWYFGAGKRRTMLSYPSIKSQRSSAFLKGSTRSTAAPAIWSSKSGTAQPRRLSVPV